MAYRALYRTYRPRDFDEVAGQNHIVKTFKNALVNDKISHAYLFSGPRGTGKTSVAKIVAKAVNCEQAPVANPCNACATCKGIDLNTINDVIEIDAASNNGVDEIREIRDKVKYLPGSGRYKVYIVDEVHMLSTGAFNALLKTLEEPPKHVIFILATTEPHKVPATIHSRCQRFDFRGIAIPAMLEKLDEIIAKETIEIETNAKQLIAERAEGGMRDAISLLDQVISYADGTIQADDVHAILGSVPHEAVNEIAQAIEKKAVVEALEVVERLSALGKESHKLIDDMIGFYREILMVKNTEVDEETKLLYKDEGFQSLCAQLSNAKLFFYIDILHDTRQKIRYAENAKLYVELALLKMLDQEAQKPMLALERIEALENRLENFEAHPIQSSASNTTETERSTEQVEKTFDEPSNSTFEPSTQTDEDEKTSDQLGTPQAEVESSIETPDKNAENDFEADPLDTLYQKFSTKPYKTFDIHFVEDVLNTSDRGTRIQMVRKWYDIERFAKGDDLQYAKMVTDGTLVATNGVMLLVTYESFPMCNKVMSQDVKPKILKVLEKFHQRKMLFMALPDEIWQRISSEFVDKFRKRGDQDTFITLKPIDHPRLRDIPKTDQEEFDDINSDTYKEAKNLFGDIVKVKKGDES